VSDSVGCVGMKHRDPTVTRQNFPTFHLCSCHLLLGARFGLDLEDSFTSVSVSCGSLL
jgi:hypothetical protein